MNLHLLLMCSRFGHSRHVNCMFTHYPVQVNSRHALMLDNSLKITDDSAGLVEPGFRRGFPALHSFVGSFDGGITGQGETTLLCVVLLIDVSLTMC